MALLRRCLPYGAGAPVGRQCAHLGLAVLTCSPASFIVASRHGSVLRGSHVCARVHPNVRPPLPGHGPGAW